MSEDVQQVFEQCKWLIERGRAKEQAKLLLPRIASKRRVENKEKKTRVVFECDPENFSQFWAQLKRYRELIENVTMAHQIMCEILECVPDETIRAIAEERMDTQHLMGKDQYHAE